VHLEGRNLARMRRPVAPGYTDASNLDWYFRRPPTAEFQTLKYLEFFRRYYLTTEEIGRPLRARQTFLGHVQTERGLRQKVLVERLPENYVVTRMQTIPVREKELFYLRALGQGWPRGGSRPAGPRFLPILGMERFQF
jgi:hypothetical protein